MTRENITPQSDVSVGFQKEIAVPLENAAPIEPQPQPKEIGGRGGLDPTRFGDWEKNGRCIDF
jgi:hypothetical protein